MRVLLIYPGRLLGGEQPLGILYLSASLKQTGNETKVWVPQLIDYLMGKFIFSRDSLLREIEHFNPQLVGLSVDSSTFLSALKIARIIKMRTNVPVILGGPHATVDPEGALESPVVDMICIGEGEEALIELVDKMEKGDDITRVENIWCKFSGKIFRNPLRPLTQELDSIPFPDRDAFSRKIYTEQGLNIITSRGCPYHCSYCVEDYWHHLYNGKGRLLRFRDINRVIEELRGAVKNYNPKTIIFSDETFTAYRKRCVEFLQMYEKQIGLPFLCQTRANTVDRETLKALINAGCIGVHIGIEAGNDRIRNEILERGMSKENIINAFKLAKEVGLNTGSFNLLGAPSETEETIWESIELNRQVKPDEVLTSILMPFKGTKVRALFEKNDWLTQEDKIHEYGLSVQTRLPTISRYQLLSYNTFFEAYVRSARRDKFMLDILRRAYEIFLRLLPRNSFLERIAQLIMSRVLKMILKLRATL